MRRNRSQKLEFIARREYEVAGSPDRRVLVRLAAPFRDGKDWKCVFEVRGLGPPRVRRAFGIDPLFALQNALEGLRTALRSSRLRLRLRYPGAKTGDIGLPQIVPQFFGTKFERHIERIVDREKLLFARDLERKAKRRR